jgi:hypothetical protein
MTMTHAADGTPGDGRRASRILIAVASGSTTEIVTLEELLDALDRRAFGFVLMLVALINCVPLPPGVSSLAGVPVFLVGLQLLAGRHHPWLPQLLRRRAFRRRDVLRVLHAAAPYLDRLERLCHPRLPRLAAILSPYPIGAVVVLLSLFIMTPMMFTNIPPAMATVFLAIVLMENDGLMMVVGILLAFLAMAVSATLAAGTIALVLVTAGRLMGW